MKSVVLFCLPLFGSLVAVAESKPAKVVNVYSSRHYDIDKEIQKKFTAETGIQVQEVQVKEASQLIERLKSEGSRSPADVLLTVDVGNLWRAAEADLLQPLKDPELEAATPANMRDTNGRWFSITSRARVIAYNKEKVPNPDVKNYEDLASEKYRGKVLVRPSSHVYNQSLVASFVFAKGNAEAEKWTNSFSGNLARKPEGNDTDQLKALGSGLGEYAVVNSYYFARLLKSNDEADKKLASKIGLIFPNQDNRGTHINVSGGGVTKHAPNLENAKAFLRYLLRPEVQKMLADFNNEYPVRSGVVWDSVVQGFGTPKFDAASLTSIGEKTPEAVKAIDRSGWR
jgi:iron(III) transport system substrate-binding protein